MAVKPTLGGEKLQAALDKIASQLSRGGTLRVGFLEDAKYPDGTSVAMVAAIQEFGAPSRKIPARPFFRPMIAEETPALAPKLGALAKAMDYDGGKMLKAIGQDMQAALKIKIQEVDSPALSPVTLMLRKMRRKNKDLVVTGATVGEAARLVAAGKSYAGVSIKPLVDTGDLLRAVSYEVDAEE